MKILIATVRVPFVHGGAEILAENLRAACVAAGHETEIVAIPFKWYPTERIPEQMLACRLLKLDERAEMVDRVIGLKFPAYLIPHPQKVFWLVHQHRQAYDLWNHPMGDMHMAACGAQVRAAVQAADKQALLDSGAVYTIAKNVSRRLKVYCGVDSEAIYHPPQNAEQFYTDDAQPYLFFPSRIDRSKRQDLVLKALAKTKAPVRVRFAGTAADPHLQAEFEALAQKHRVADRVEWLGRVSEGRKRELYAQSLAVVYPPLDEDYGYVTLEAMLSSKPVLTCTDSGGPLEFIHDGESGLVSEPSPEALAESFDRVWLDRSRAAEMGRAARGAYDALELSWSNVVERLAA